MLLQIKHTKLKTATFSQSTKITQSKTEIKFIKKQKRIIQITSLIIKMKSKILIYKYIQYKFIKWDKIKKML